MVKSARIGMWRSAEQFFETPHDKPPKYALMITVYLDESRHSDPNSYMVVAGFWGNKEQWNALIPDWIAGLGKKQSLHMNSLRMNSKPERARKLLNTLGPLPYKHGLKPIYGAVKTGDYLDILTTPALRKKFPGYVICLTAIMQRLSIKVPLNESIKIVCEIQKTYEEAALRTFGQIRVSKPISNPERAYFSGIEFIPKDSSILTQPSDYLAYALAESHENQNSPKAKLCKAICGPPGACVGLTLGHDQIRHLISGARHVFERWQNA